MKKEKIAVPYGDTELIGDIISDGEKPKLLILHGAGTSNRKRFDNIRELLVSRGVSSVAFDFIGHGETGGELKNSSLKDRTQQALAVIKQLDLKAFSILGSSMSGYTAIKLTQEIPVHSLILGVPAVYNESAYDLHFDSSFTGNIQEPDSWMKTDAWSILNCFNGNLLIYSGGRDTVIPVEVIQKIYSSALSSKKEILNFSESDHQINLFFQEYPEELQKLINKIIEFI